jgi:hypothetical protein
MKAKFLGKFLPKSVRSFVHNILTVDFREPINICDVPNAMTMTYLNLSARVYHWCQRHQRKVYAQRCALSAGGQGRVHLILGDLHGLNPPSIAHPTFPYVLYNRMQRELSGMWVN